MGRAPLHLVVALCCCLVVIFPASRQLNGASYRLGFATGPESVVVPLVVSQVTIGPSLSVLTPGSARTSGQSQEADSSQETGASVAEAPAPPGPIEYTVKAGDTLGSI